VYSVKPVAPAGSNYFEVIPDSNTNMCLDVAGGPSATQNGAVVQLWQCLGENQTNQIWHIVELASPNQGWFAFIAKHSGRCMTVSENSTANGARFLQWDCAWAGSQQWRWLPVG
jgi:glucosylceramidase